MKLALTNNELSERINAKAQKSVACVFIYLGAAAALADLFFPARGIDYRAPLFLADDVHLLAADLGGQLCANAHGGSGGARSWSPNVE